MALTISRVQYLAVRATKNVFCMRDKNCCTLYFSNLTLKRSISNRISDCNLEPNDEKYIFNTVCDSRYPITTKEQEMIKLLFTELKLNENVIKNELLKHPKRKCISLQQIRKTLSFLNNLGYTRQLIADSPAICFYPVGNIKTGLEEIARNSEELNKFGFVNGSVQDNTLGFLYGSKSRDKTLQLCLYYIELPFGFNGNGIFDLGGSDLSDRETEQQ